MYRQTKEAIKRGDVFQQRPCPFYHEMHRIFSGNDDTDQSALNSQSLNNDEENLGDDENEEIDEEQQQQQTMNSSGTDDKLSHVIDRFIQFQQQSEVKKKEKKKFTMNIGFIRHVGTNLLNNRPISNCNVDKKIEHINYN